MTRSALQEAEEFLWKHPHATTDVDNPITLLREVVDECSDLENQLENTVDQSDLDAKDEEISELQATIDRMAGFLRKLREEMKICDLELRAALTGTTS